LVTLSRFILEPLKQGSSLKMQKKIKAYFSEPGDFRMLDPRDKEKGDELLPAKALGLLASDSE